MAAFLIDEDLPRSLARVLRGSGLLAEDVRDLELRGKPDDDIFQYAVSHNRALLSADLSLETFSVPRSGPTQGLSLRVSTRGIDSLAERCDSQGAPASFE